MPRQLLILLSVSLLLKLVVFFISSAEQSRFLTGDSWGYHNPARAILNIGSFAISPEHPDVPESIRTPGYPLFIAVVYAVFGESFQAVVVVQIILSLITVVISYHMGRSLFGENAGFLAAIVLCLDVVTFSMTFFVLTETLFTLVFTLSLLSGVRILRRVTEVEAVSSRTVGARRSELMWSLMLGFSFALSILIRPVAYYLVPVLIVFFLVVGMKRKLGVRWITQTALAILLPALLLVGGWQVRNARVIGSASLTQIEGVDALYYRAAAVVSLRDGVTLDEARMSLGGLSMTDAWNEVRNQPHRLLGDSWRAQALEVLIRHPLLTMRMMLNGIINMCLGPGDGQLTGLLGWRPDKDGPLGDLVRISTGDFIEKWVAGRPMETMFFIHALGYIVFLWLFFAVGMVRLLRTGKELWIHLFLLGVVVYFVLVSAGPHSYHRFRMPLMPVFSIYAGHVMMQFVDWRKRRGES